MATWYTDNITGNDTTGNGTIATPYKTILKAFTVAANDDTINVAGSGYTTVAATLTPTGIGGNVFNTSVNLTAVLPQGTIFCINDGAWGSRKHFFKVQSVAATTVTVTTAIYLPVAGYTNIEKITTNYYSTTTASTNLEDLTTVNKTGIKIEGGWTNNFTAQDGITWFVYSVASTAASGTVLRSTFGNNVGLSVNNIGVAAMTPMSSLANSATIPAYYGNLYLIGGTLSIVANARANPSGCNFYINTNTDITASGNTTDPLQIPLLIDNLYLSNIGKFGGNEDQCFIIDNLWGIAIGNNGYATNGTGQLRFASIDVNNLNIYWTAVSTTDQSYTLVSGDVTGNIILRNITNLGNYGGAGKRPIFLRNSAKANIQIIAPTQNVDTWGIQDLAFVLSNYGVQNFQPIKDIEGHKQYWSAGSIIFADQSVFETGTNSLRVSRPVYVDGSTAKLTPVKSLYVDSSTAKTITIRVKASVSSTVRWSLIVNGTFASAATYNPPIPQTTTVGTDWTTVTYTISADLAARLNESYVNFGIVMDSWSSQYIWIDQITIA